MWEDNIHDELSKFYASCNHDEFVDWLNTITKVLKSIMMFPMQGKIGI